MIEVELDERETDGEGHAGLGGNRLEDARHGARDDACRKAMSKAQIETISNKKNPIAHLDRARASHGVGLATGLTVGKYGSVEAIDGGGDVGLDVLENLALAVTSGPSRANPLAPTRPSVRGHHTDTIEGEALDLISTRDIL